jgi:hypothetical protein
MKTKLLAVLLLAAASALAAPRVVVGVGVGGYRHGYAYRGYPYRAYPYGAYVADPVVTYAPPVPYYGPAYYEPPMPSPGYVWIGGWGGHAGYWSRPAYAGAGRAAPRGFGGRYYGGRGRR